MLMMSRIDELSHLAARASEQRIEAYHHFHPPEASVSDAQGPIPSTS